MVHEQYIYARERHSYVYHVENTGSRPKLSNVGRGLYLDG